MFEMSVVTPLVKDIDGDQRAAHHADGQATDVNESESFISHDMAQCDLKIVGKHIPVLLKYEDALDSLSPNKVHVESYVVWTG